MAQRKLTLYSHEEGFNMRYYLDVIENATGDLEVKWAWDPVANYCPISDETEMLPCPHLLHSPLVNTFVYENKRYWLCDVVGAGHVTLFKHVNGISGTHGYVDVILRGEELLVKWNFEEDNEYGPVQNLEMRPCHHVPGAPEVPTFTFGGWRYWLCDVVDSFIPKEFEYFEILGSYGSDNKYTETTVGTYVTILDTFTHHYTKETHYHVRVEHSVADVNRPAAEYKILNSVDMAYLLMNREKGV